MASVRMRTFAFDAITAGIAIALFLAATAVTVGWNIALVAPWQRAAAIALVATTLAALVFVRIQRTRWLLHEALYEDFGVFATHAAVEPRSALRIGRYFIIGGLAHGATLPHLFRGRVLPIRTAYDELQLAHRTGNLDDHTFRTAVDELFAHAEHRSRLANLTPPALNGHHMFLLSGVEEQPFVVRTGLNL